MKGSDNSPWQRILGFFARFEGTIAVLFLALLVALKIIYTFALPADSDEPQHLHVVWGWANGYIPYRDFFDNHSPLFQLLCVPLFRGLGERADIIIPMRLAVVPLYFVCLWCAYRIGTILFSWRVGTWAGILGGAYPIFFAKSSEFRTDDFWAPLWLLSVLALLKRPLDVKSSFLFGLALGASFATSMKTSALLIGLTCALIVLLAEKAVHKTDFAWKRLPALALAAFLGSALIPAVVVAFFSYKGALPNLYYCIIQHNILPGFFELNVLQRIRVVVPLLALSSIGGYLSWRNAEQTTKRGRIAMLALTSTAFCIVIGVFWPITESQDILPIVPLAFPLAVFAIWTALTDKDHHLRHSPRSLVLSILAAGEIVALLLFYPPHLHALDGPIAKISSALTLTTKKDFVMDSKGETIFRRRSCYYVLETLTSHRLALGLIKDEIPERLIATRAPIASILRTPPRARAFIEQNYLPIAFHTQVLGQMLNSREREFPKSYGFDVVIPANYALVSEQGKLVATLDGTGFQGSRFLAVGHHEVLSFAGAGRLAVIWSVAPENGFSPFSPLAIDVANSKGY